MSDLVITKWTMVPTGQALKELREELFDWTCSSFRATVLLEYYLKLLRMP